MTVCSAVYPHIGWLINIRYARYQYIDGLVKQGLNAVTESCRNECNFDQIVVARKKREYEYQDLIGNRSKGDVRV